MTETQPANTIDGKDTASGPFLTVGANDQFNFSVTLQQNVALTSPDFTGNNFGERGLRAAFLSVQDLLLSSHRDGAPNASKGLIFSFNDTGTNDLSWYLTSLGWDGIKDASLVLNNQNAI